MRTVLIVDDSPDIRDLLRQALEMEGYHVEHAENGAIARAMLVNGLRPCLLLLDLMMPVMDGKEFLAWKNKENEMTKVPVVIISALAADASLEGTQGYLRKPIDLGEMFGYVEGLCCG